MVPCNLFDKWLSFLTVKLGEKCCAFRTAHSAHPSFFRFRNSQKFYLGKPSKIYFYRKSTPILNHLGQTFLAVVGTEEEDSSNSMLPASAILENCCLGALKSFGIMIFFEWEIPEVDCSWHTTEYCIKKIARKTKGSAKEALNISKFP